MYQVTIKGRNLKELKKAVADIYNELNGTENIVKNVTVEKILEEVEEVKPISEPKVKEEPAISYDNAELDTEGIPWDKRIHSSGKTKDKRGVWIKRRGTTQADLNTVKEELRNKMYNKTNPPAIPDLPPDLPVNIPPVIEEKPVIETPPVVPSTPNGHSIETFKANFAVILATLISENKITQEYVNTLKDYFKVNQIWDLSEAQKEEMFESFVQFGFIQKV